MYLPRSHTGNIFPSRTVVVWRHHVYVREFHRPSCNSVEHRAGKAVRLASWRKMTQPGEFCC